MLKSQYASAKPDIQREREKERERERERETDAALLLVFKVVASFSAWKGITFQKEAH